MLPFARQAWRQVRSAQMEPAREPATSGLSLDRVGADYDNEVQTLSGDSEQGQALMLEHLTDLPAEVLVDGKAFFV